MQAYHTHGFKKHLQDFHVTVELKI